ncbi:recombinase family protein [Ruminiclostridium papyrosolvens]|uniref:Serine recombinase n=1 Tax=Ruminiclostridium papyrosolvens C7 TaxID=1330534 RepID=U4R602_9FIRM|nr:recombinase family protein [Ruminiclostridium papyrosolvens]EPR14125.1 serine recombinase [Ruminiclostridium papyrosolvens C7]
MVKTCIYLRKSREDERMEKELGKGETLSKHREDLLSFARKKDLCIVNIYEELVTGESLLYRPAMLELLKDVEAGVYDAVLVMDLQRLGRGDMEEQGIILKAFKNTNTKIITPDKEYDLSNEFDEEYSEFEAFMSRKEYKMINKRLQRGIIHSVNSGNYNSPYPPFGYIIKQEKLGRTLEPHAQQSEVLKCIFNWYVNESVGSQIIAQRLNSMGLKTNKNNNWTCQAVTAILKNPVYTGKIAWRKTTSNRLPKKKSKKTQPRQDWILAEGKHPALISESIYQKAQSILKNNIKTHTKQSSGLQNTLAGIVVCGVCGAKMRYRPYLNSEPHLICINKCGNKSSKFNYIEDCVLSSLNEYLNEYTFELSGELQNKNSSQAALKNSAVMLEKQLKEAYLQKENVYNLLEKGVYSIEDFNQRLILVNTRIDELRQSISNIGNLHKKTLSQKPGNAEVQSGLTKIMKIYKNLRNVEDKNVLLKSVLGKVEYFKGKDCRNDNFMLRIYPLI